MSLISKKEMEKLGFTITKLKDLEKRVAKLESELKVEDIPSQDFEASQELAPTNMEQSHTFIIPAMSKTKPAWWNDRINTGDTVYIKSRKKFGIFMGPSFKQGLLKIRLLKTGDKNEVYTRNWVLPENDVEIVKSNNKTHKKYIEHNNSSIKIQSNFKTGDIVYVEKIKKFGIVLNMLNNAIVVTLFKEGTKSELEGTSSTFNPQTLQLVKRGNQVRRGFVETETKYRLKNDI